ncbi:MAG: transcription termination/antitermination NusG family protein, partial [Methylocella sp.]
MEGRVNWYVCYTHANAEARAAERLERHGFKAFLPMLKLHVRRRRKRRAIERPLFPNYLFLGFTAAPPWLEVTKINGIAAVIRSSAAPLRIDNTIIDQLRQRIAAGEFAKHNAPPAIRPGMTVRIGGGAMDGNHGLCEKVTGDRKADVLIAMLGQTVRVKIAMDRLVAIP